jgi:hypothetical protein
MIDRKLKNSWCFIKMAERTAKNDWVTRGHGRARSVGSIGATSARSGRSLDHMAWGQHGRAKNQSRRACGRGARLPGPDDGTWVYHPRWCIMIVPLDKARRQRCGVLDWVDGDWNKSGMEWGMNVCGFPFGRWRRRCGPKYSVRFPFSVP